MHKDDQNTPWTCNIFTIFPEIFPGSLGVSNIGKALEQNVWRLRTHNLLHFANRHGRIDDTIYGGGCGMLLRPDVFQRAFDAMSPRDQSLPCYYPSPRGDFLTQSEIEQISKGPGLNILCGRYEGIDQRIIEHYHMREFSIGDFVLLGGEVAALALTEATVRLLPGIVAKNESILHDSFQNGLLEHNLYTRPFNFLGQTPPEWLLSGNHQEIERMRLEESQRITRERRPQMWKIYQKHQERERETSE